MAAGWNPNLFWDLTIHEIEAVFNRSADREKAANLRAGLVAATIANVHRRKGAPMIKPSDFLRQPVVRMDPEEAAKFMDSWAAGQNEVMDDDARGNR